MAAPANGAAAGGGYGGLVSGLGIASGLLNKRKDQSGAGLLSQMAMNPQLMQGLQGAFRSQPGQADPTMLPPGQAPGGMPGGMRNPEMGGGAGVTPMGGGAMQAQPAMGGPPPGMQPGGSMGGGIGGAMDGRTASNWSMDGDRPRWRAATQPLFGGGSAGPPMGGAGPMPPIQPMDGPAAPGMSAGAFQLPRGANLGGAAGGFQMSDAPKFPPFSGAGPGGMPQGGSGSAGPSGPPPFPMSKPMGGGMQGGANMSGAGDGAGPIPPGGLPPAPPRSAPSVGTRMPPPGDPGAFIAQRNATNPGAAQTYAGGAGPAMGGATMGGGAPHMPPAIAPQLGGGGMGGGATMGAAIPPMHPMSLPAGSSGAFPAFQARDPGIAAAGPPGQMGDAGMMPPMGSPIGMTAPSGMDPQRWARIQQQLASQGPGLGGGAF